MLPGLAPACDIDGQPLIQRDDGQEMDINPIAEPDGQSNNGAVTRQTGEREQSRMSDVGLSPLSNSQKLGLALLFLLLVGFGILVEVRGAFLKRRMTDVGCYLRAAWAVRTGGNMYSVTDDNGWHYNYPPLLAILLVPLSDAPPGADRLWMLPYAVSVGLWYVVTLACGFGGAHMLAKAIEESSPDPAARNPPLFCRRWFALRIMPILILLPAIGRSQARGQIGLLLGLFLCGIGRAMIRQERFRAGLWLAAAISIKAIPAYLLLLPLWRRDHRMLAGCTLGLVLGLAFVPALAMGPRQAADAYRTYFFETLWPGVTGDTQGSRGGELTGVTSTDSNAPVVVIHNLMYPNRQSRPKEAYQAVRITHWAFGAVLTLLTLVAAGWRGGGSGRCEVIFLGALTILMWVVSPVFHPHYVSMGLPLVIGVMAMSWETYGYPRIGALWRGTFGLLILAHLLTVLPDLEFLRDGGLVLWSALAVWGGSLVVMRRASRQSPAYAGGHQGPITR